MRSALKHLFKALDTPIDERDPYDETVKPFPYVNGGLFTEDTEIPNFDEDLKFKLLFELSQKTDWSKISPTIFGGIFEGTLNPETRRSGGMHYTSPENIHKVIDPLFLDDLNERFRAIKNDETLTDRQKRNSLQKLHQEICSLSFFDPACGSGNFLTETFLCLRRLEDDILRVLHSGQTIIDFSEEPISDRVSLKQFYGIEINDFAVRVAKTALWIAQLQSNVETEITLDVEAKNFPLTDSATIVEGNALRLNWQEVLSASECDYIIGNPPFIGARNQTKEQKQEVIDAFRGAKNCGNVDYVAAWYAKAADYMTANHLLRHPEERVSATKDLADEGSQIKVEILQSAPPEHRSFDSLRSSQDDVNVRCAFVSTNSICQGEQVANIWKPIFDAGFHIDFAHNTFRWSNEATDTAHVFCVIVGFSKQQVKKRLFLHKTPDSEAVEVKPNNINAYLVDAPDVFIWNASKPKCSIAKMGIGSQPIDGGNYIFDTKEKEDFLRNEPKAKAFFHRFMGSNELLNNVERYVLWLGEVQPWDLKQLPLCRERIDLVREYRLNSKRKQTQKAAETPNHFGTEIIPETTSIIFPRVSSERRHYVPIGFVEPDVFCSDAALLVANVSLFHFGILSSQFHNAWMRVVCGRLKSDYRYFAGIVYNNFPWPGVTKETLATTVEDCVSKEVREKIETCAQEVLDAREFYVNQAKDAGQTCSLADMYDPDNDFLYPKLTSAHNALDAAVEEAYGVNFNGDEEKIVAHLFGLYEGLTK